MLWKNIQYLLKLLCYILGLGTMQIVITVSFAVAAQPTTSDSIAGCYYDLVTPISFADGKPHPAYSTLELTPMGKDRYEFSVIIIGGNFDVCGGGGIAVVKKRGRNAVLEMLPDEKQIEEEAEWGSEPCQLRIRFTRNKVMIEDENGACRKYFGCGDRAFYSDAIFMRKDKRTKCPDQP